MKSKLLSMGLVLAFSGVNVGYADQNAMLAAKKFLDKGQVKAAVIELKNHLQENPDDIEARLLIGETYLRMGDGAAASKAFEKAKELKAPKERWILSLGRAYLLQNDTKAILDQIKPDPSLPTTLQAQIYGLIGTVYTSLAKRDKAQESFDAALKLDPDASEALLGLGLLSADKGDYKKTAEYAKRVLAKDDKNLSAWVVLAETQRMTGDNAGAAESFGKAIDVRPNDPRARLGRATAYLAQGKVQEASKDLDEIRKTNGELPLALYLQAIIDFQNKKLDEAQDLLNKVATALPDYLPAKLLIGTIAYQKGELETAENNLTAFNKAAPMHVPAAKLLAATRLKQGRASDAIPVLKAVETSAKQDSQLLSLLGTAYMQTRQMDLGKDYLARAAALDPKAAGIRTQMALGQLASGNLDGAIKDLKSAVELDQNLHQADVMLILALLQDKKFDEAVEAANKLKAKSKGDPMAENLLGAAYMAKGDQAKAREHWVAALEMKPEYSTAGLNLARLEMSRNNPEGAIKQLQGILEHDPKNLQALIGLASVAEAKKDYAKMESYLLEAREKNPNELEPALMLGKYYQATGKALKSLELARDLSSRNPDNPAAMQFLATAQIANNQLPNGLLTLKKLVGKAPQNPDYRLQYVQTLRRSGEMTEAITELNSLVKAFPDYVPGQLALSEVALVDKKYDEASKIASSLQSKYPKQAAGYRLEGDILFSQKQYPKGVQSYKRAFDLEPDSASARRLFLAYRTAGDDKSAFEAMNQWLKNNGSDVESWLALAMAYQSTGQKKEATTAYEKCLELRPDNSLIQNNLAWLYQDAGDKRALGLAEKLTSSMENNPSIMDTVGWIFVQNDKVDKGLSLLEDAALHAPFQTEIRVHLAEALFKAGKKSEAKEAVQKLLNEKKSFPERQRAEELLKKL